MDKEEMEALVEQRKAKGTWNLKSRVGVLNPQARFTEDEIRDIKFGSLSAMGAAIKYGTHPNYVHQIRRGARWKHIRRDR